MKSKIYLIGLPGSGKTTLGRMLATRLRIPFVDLDKEIEKQEGKIIPEIFSTQGEDYFRSVESTLLKKWAAQPGNFVMGTGGGAPCFHNGIEVINTSGVSVFLNVKPIDLVRRLESKTDRPLLSRENNEELFEKISQLHRKRLPIYQKASVTIEEATVEKIMEQLASLS